uniref:GRAM domain-containing protein 2B-like isoform X2 n=1 Tax=Gasterosteus aculeatus aculeatus TaxID=481459 RepID=UPI001A996495|nr:GRAM domain-containing protein 2B-like isoform X2 [Gasterosteus aculeatus aculeatus]
MTMRSRRFSLDGSECVDFGRGRRRSSSRFGIKNRRDCGSLEDARLEIQELDHSLNSSVSPRNQTIAEDSVGHSDGLIHTARFLRHRKSFYKQFHEVPEGESLLHTFSCALQKEVLYQGRLFVSENYVCFYSSVLLKDTKVVIPASSVMQVKKHSSALSVLSIKTADGEKHTFMSLTRRETCYKLLQALCLQEKSINSSPHPSFAENEADNDMASSFSSLEDSVDRDLSRQSSFSQMSSEAPTRRNSTRQNSSTDEDNGGEPAKSWIRRIIETVAPLFFLRELRSLGVLFYVYMMLLVLLLLASGYIGLRMVALEEQLVEMSTQRTRYPHM